MKTSRLAFPGRFLAVSLLLSAGCSREKNVTATAEPPKPTTTPARAPSASPAPATPAPPPATADPFSDMNASLERATLEQHDGLGEVQQRMDQNIAAQVTARKAGADVSLTAGQKLDAASTDFAEKLRMLSVARPETWSTAKHDAIQALQNVRAAYAEVMTSPARR